MHENRLIDRAVYSVELIALAVYPSWILGETY